MQARRRPSNSEGDVVGMFNRKLYEAKEFYTTILPIRDGLAVAVKK